MAFSGLTGRPPKIDAASWPHFRAWITCWPTATPSFLMTPMMFRSAGSLAGPMTKSGAASA